MLTLLYGYPIGDNVAAMHHHHLDHHLDHHDLDQHLNYHDYLFNINRMPIILCTWLIKIDHDTYCKDEANYRANMINYNNAYIFQSMF